MYMWGYKTPPNWKIEKAELPDEPKCIMLPNAWQPESFLQAQSRVNRKLIWYKKLWRKAKKWCSKW